MVEVNHDSLLVDTLILGPDFRTALSDIPATEREIAVVSHPVSRLIVPVQGRVLSRYGMRRGRMHTGIDLKLNLGDTVFAAGDGTVSRATRYYGYGNLVVLNHSDGLETYYAHLSAMLVGHGDRVFSGQPLGLGGRTGRATGNHLHFEIRENGKAYNPEWVYDFERSELRPEVFGAEGMASLATLPSSMETVQITNRGNSYAMEMSTASMAEYVIRTGDSLWKIARQFNTTVPQLCEQNNLTTRSILRIGTVLKIIPSD